MMNERPVLFFDCMGTVFDVSDVPTHQMTAYTRAIRRCNPLRAYPPLQFDNLRAHPDAQPALARLAEKFDVVAFTNCPPAVFNAVTARAQLVWHDVVPLLRAGASKPVPYVYPWACGWWNRRPEQCTMVTANPTFGDVEGARACGMNVILVRCRGVLVDLLALADLLGC